MKRVFSWTTHEEAAREEGRYWRSVSIEERVSAVELLREVTPGVYGEVPARLERVHQLFVLAPRALPRRRRARARSQRKATGETDESSERNQKRR